MRKKLGKTSSGLLCIAAAILWFALKFEYCSMLFGHFRAKDAGGFDQASGLRVLLFILSPGLILLIVGTALILASRIARPRAPRNPVAT